MASKSKAKVWRKKVSTGALPIESISAKPTAAKRPPKKRASTKPMPVSSKKKQTQTAAKKKPRYRIAMKQQSTAETTKKSAIIGSGQRMAKTATSAVKKNNIRCEICKLECSSQLHLEQHCRGKKHRNAVASKTESGTKKSKPVIRKEAAARKKKHSAPQKKVSESQKGKAVVQKQSAAKKKPKQKNVKKSLATAKTTKKSAIIGSGQRIAKTATSTVKKNKNRCEICKLECSSQLHLAQHCRGKKHRKAMALKTESTTRTKESESQKGKAVVQKQVVDFQIECICGATMKKTTTGGRHSKVACVECGSRVPVYYQCPAGNHPHCVCVLCAAIIERLQRVTLVHSQIGGTMLCICGATMKKTTTGGKLSNVACVECGIRVPVYYQCPAGKRPHCVHCVENCALIGSGTVKGSVKKKSCELCKVKCNSHMNWKQHCQAKKHKQALASMKVTETKKRKRVKRKKAVAKKKRRKNIVICDICEAECLSMKDLARHCRVEMMAEKKRHILTEACFVCNEVFSGKHHYAQHFSEKKHEVNAKRYYYCERCECRLRKRRGASKMHMASARHCMNDMPLLQWILHSTSQGQSHTMSRKKTHRKSKKKRATTSVNALETTCVKCGKLYGGWAVFRCTNGTLSRCLECVRKYEGVGKVMEAKTLMRTSLARRIQVIETTQTLKQLCALGESLVDGGNEFKFRKTVSGSLTRTDLSTGVGSDFRQLLSDDFLWPDFWWKDAGEPTFFESLEETKTNVTE